MVVVVDDDVVLLNSTLSFTAAFSSTMFTRSRKQTVPHYCQTPKYSTVTNTLMHCGKNDNITIGKQKI